MERETRSKMQERDTGEDREDEGEKIQERERERERLTHGHLPQQQHIIYA